MKVLNEADIDSRGKSKPGNTYVLIMSRQEAMTLVEIAEAAYMANKRKTTFRRWWKRIEGCMECYR